MKNKTNKVLIFVILLIFLFVLHTPETFSIYKTNLSTTINLTITDGSDYIISFDSQGGNSIASKSVTPNQAIGTLQIPTKTNFNFIGWYDENGNKVDHNTIATRSMQLTAHWQKIVCKKVASDSDLHRETCAQSSGNGCRKAGYAEQSEIKYGLVPTDNSPVVGDAYDCDVDNDGVYNSTDEFGKYIERFYYIRENTTDDTAVLVYYTSYDENGRVDSQHRTIPENGGGSYPYAQALTHLPVNTGNSSDPDNWDNPELVEFDSTNHNTGRLLTLDDVEASCGTFAGSGSSYLYSCQFLLENSRFQSASMGRAGIWTVVNSNNEYYRIQTQTLIYEKKDASSSNTVRPVIEIPLIDLDGYMDEDEFTISFDVHNGSALTSVRRYRGQTVGSLPTPHRENYTFVNWYKDAGYNTVVNPNEVVDSNMTLHAKWEYVGSVTVTFVLNGGTGIPNSITVDAGDTIDPWLEPTYTGKTFAGWYIDEECEDYPFTENDVVTTNIILYAKWNTISGVAAVNNVGYSTLQEAINAVPKNGADYTEVVILQNINLDSPVSIKDGRKVELNIGPYAITRSNGVLFSNYATLKIKNGTITTSGSNNAYAIDNKSTGVLNITGGTLSATNTSSTNTNIIANVGIVNITGGRLNCDTQAAALDNNGGIVTMSGGEIISTNSLKCQAMYNNGGTITISGNAYLESSSTNRYTLHNYSGTMYITGGTIVANSSSAVYNKNSQTLTIGNDDGTISTSTPILQGKTYGLELDSTATATVSDGLFRSQDNSVAINVTSRTITPNNTEYVTSEIEFVEGVAYHKAYLKPQTVTVTFEKNDGTGTKTTRVLSPGSQVGELTPVTRENYIFVGWFTEAENGTQITDPTTVVDADVSYYAHWIPDISNATINPSSISVYLGYTETITVTGPSDMESYSFSSNDTSVALVTNEGVVSGVGLGTTTITITGSSSTATRTVSVTVTTPKYILNFYKNDGTNNSIEVEINQGSSIDSSLPSAPLRENYMFDGWYTDTNYTTQVTSETTPSSNASYYAKWTGNINIATISPSSISVFAGQLGLLSITSTDDMESYTLTSNNSNVATVTNAGQVLGVNIGTTTITMEGTRSHLTRTIDVEVTEVKYTVTFKDGSTIYETVSNITKNSTLGNLMPIDPTKTGYIFEKWYIYGFPNSTFDGTTQISSDLDVIAKWKEDITTATITPSPITIVLGETGQLTVSATDPSNDVEDYTISSSNTNIIYIDNDKVLHAENLGSVTLTLTGKESGEPTTVSATVTDKYTVDFESDGVIYDTKNITKNTAIGNNLPTPPTKSGYVFVGWYTTSTEPYTTRVDEETIIDSNKTYYARWASNTYHAEMNGELYTTVQEAVDIASTAKTTIRLLQSVTYTSMVDLWSKNNDKNIVLDLNNFTLQTNTYVVRSKATIEIINGNIKSTGGSGAVEANGGTMTIRNVNITNTNNRQAIYNDGGTINIYGGNMSAKPATDKVRGVIHNVNGTLNIYDANVTTITTGSNNGIALYVANGIVNVYGGTFTATSSTSGYGLRVDKGTVTIGNIDGTHSTSSIAFVGVNNGITTSQDISFYDGIIKAKDPNAAINNEAKLANVESGFTKVNDTETISGTTYNVLYYESSISYYRINYNTNSGTIDRNYDDFVVGTQITTNDLPTPTRANYTFVGWCTDENLQNDFAPFTPNSAGSTTYYAKWSYNPTVTPVLHVITSDAMTAYFNNIDSWVAADAKDPTNSDNDSTNDHYNFFYNMNTTFTENSCSSCGAANNCSSPSSGTYCEQPKGYNTGYNQTINVYPYVNDTKGNEIVSYITVENGVIYNMIPGESYYWELANDSTTYGIVTATGNRRTLYSPVRNLRDLGGMSVDTNNDGVSDGTLKYGILYRGAQNASGQTGVNSLTKLGITREIDLRADGDGNNGQSHLPNYDVDYDDQRFEYPEFQITGNNPVTNPSDDETKGYKDIVITNYIINPTTTAYFNTAHLDNYKAFKSALKQVMRQVADGDSIYFHCTIGTDRTGTLAYFLEGLLGVPLKERLKDYELTYFYGLTNRHRFHNLSNQTFPFQLSWNSDINPRFEAMYKSYDTYQKIYEFYTYIPEDDDATVLANFRNAMIQSNS